MTAAKTPGNRDTQSELVISCDLGKTSNRGTGHQPSHITFDLQAILPMRCAGVKSGIETVGGQPMTVPSSDPCHESEPTTDTVWYNRTQSWMVQRPRTEPNTLEKKKCQCNDA